MKRLGFTFRRARRVTAKPPCPKKLGRVKRALSRLHRLEDAGRCQVLCCQVLYGDESGFCLSPVVPYLWQPKGKTLGLPAKAHSRRLNILVEHSGLFVSRGPFAPLPGTGKDDRAVRDPER